LHSNLNKKEKPTAIYDKGGNSLVSTLNLKGLNGQVSNVGITSMPYSLSPKYKIAHYAA